MKIRNVFIIFIVSVSLLIFAPRSVNFYNDDTYPILKSIYENNKEIITEDFEKIEKETNWINWPDSENISGKCEIFPLYMFSIVSKKRKHKCINSYNLIQNIPGVKTCTFLKIDKKSKMTKQTQWKDLSNTTLRCLLVLKSVSSAPVEKCGIWVNGETKKLISGNLIIFDSSKEHSIYNETDYPLYTLLIDLQRPEKIPNGISQREYSDELYDFICMLNAY